MENRKIILVTMRAEMAKRYAEDKSLISAEFFLPAWVMDEVGYTTRVLIRDEDHGAFADRLRADFVVEGDYTLEAWDGAKTTT